MTIVSDYKRASIGDMVDNLERSELGTNPSYLDIPRRSCTCTRVGFTDDDETAFT